MRLTADMTRSETPRSNIGTQVQHFQVQANVEVACTAWQPVYNCSQQSGHKFKKKQVFINSAIVNWYKTFIYRTLSEFWHWFVANVPGDAVDDGEVIFDLLFPLVLPEGDGDHRYGYFVFEQPGQLDYAEEGGPTDSCSPQMSNGRGPFKYRLSFKVLNL